LGYYRLVQIGAAKVLLFNSNTHYAASQGEQDLEALTNRLIEYVKPKQGSGISDPIGTVNVVHTDALYESNRPQDRWPTYASQWTPDWSIISTSPSARYCFQFPRLKAILIRSRHNSTRLTAQSTR
jgi:hypothetical protein